jgi:hypothetical protein
MLRRSQVCATWHTNPVGLQVPPEAIVGDLAAVAPKTSFSPVAIPKQTITRRVKRDRSRDQHD